MAVIRTGAVSLALLLALSAPALAEPDCQARAQVLLKKVEARPMGQRAALILQAFEHDEVLGCGLVSTGHWSGEAVPPKGCDLGALDLCDIPQGVPVAGQVLTHVEPKTYLRVQRAATQLAAAGQLQRPLKRLLQLILLSSAIQRGG